MKKNLLEKKNTVEKEDTTKMTQFRGKKLLK
jgi:hypothetical protein